MTLETSAEITEERLSIPLSLVAVPLELGSISEYATRLLQLVQVVFCCLDLIDVSKHSSNFLLEP